MRRSTDNLTKLRVEGFPLPVKGQEFHWDTDPRGFGVGIAPGGTRTYVAQARVAGKSVRVKIGSHGRWTVSQAREAARELLLQMDKGIDPRAEKKKLQAQGITLQQLADDYCANKKTKHGPLTERTQQDIKRHVLKSFAAWTNKPVRTIDAAACRKRFAEMSATGPVQANQAFRVLRALLNYARKSSKTDEGVATLLAENPVTAISDKSMWNAETPREERIPHDKVGAVWTLIQELRAAGNQTSSSRTCADYVAFLMLTGARRGEACALTWDRVTLEKGAATWHLEDTKNHRPITRPLSEVAREMLVARYEARDEKNPYVFPGRHGASHFDGQALSVFKKVSAVAGVKLGPHSMRRTLSDAAEDAGFEHKIKHLLGHAGTSDVTTKHYANNRDPRKLVPAVNAIAAHYVQQGAIAMSKNVVALRA